MTLCWSLDKLGPMTRSVEDAMLVLQAITGPGRGRCVERAEPPGVRRDGAGRRACASATFRQWMKEPPATDVDRAALETVEDAGHVAGRR